MCQNRASRAFSEYVAALFWVIAGLGPAIHPFAKGMEPRVKPAGDEGKWRGLIGKCSSKRRNVGRRSGPVLAAAIVAAGGLIPSASFADEGGVSFWLPGLFGSLAATPATPGWLLNTFYYHTSVNAGADVARAREISIGRFNPSLNLNLSASLSADADFAWINPIYVFANPVLGGQFSAGMGGLVGRESASLSGTVTASIPPFTFIRSDSVSDSVTGIGDLYPQAFLKWNQGVNNFMIYGTGDIPVGAYSSTRLANLGIGHGAVDAGAGYTYLDPTAGHEFSAVAGFTYNLMNTSTNYQNGIDFHLDWGASQFLSKQLLVGAVGYVYDQVTGDSGSGDRVGAFESRVIGVGPQLGYIFPVGGMQGYLNLKGYREFDSRDRPSGFNVWLTFVISPAAPTAAAPKPMYRK
ncbi:MAG TPA: transporter [Xanthobacteraceae bacterium]